MPKSLRPGSFRCGMSAPAICLFPRLDESASTDTDDDREQYDCARLRVRLKFSEARGRRTAKGIIEEREDLASGRARDKVAEADGRDGDLCSIYTTVYEESRRRTMVKYSADSKERCMSLAKTAAPTAM